LELVAWSVTRRPEAISASFSTVFIFLAGPPPRVTQRVGARLVMEKKRIGQPGFLVFERIARQHAAHVRRGPNERVDPFPRQGPQSLLQ
jgi:hypothetical protein